MLNLECTWKYYSGPLIMKGSSDILSNLPLHHNTQFRCRQPSVFLCEVNCQPYCFSEIHIHSKKHRVVSSRYFLYIGSSRKNALVQSLIFWVYPCEMNLPGSIRDPILTWQLTFPHLYYIKGHPFCMYTCKLTRYSPTVLATTLEQIVTQMSYWNSDSI